MTIFVVETEGRAILAFPAPNLIDAELEIDKEHIQETLTVLTNPGGAALWDGESRLHVREAEEDEKAIWDMNVAVAIREGDLEDRQEALDDGYVVFLVPVYDPTDD